MSKRSYIKRHIVPGSLLGRSLLILIIPILLIQVITIVVFFDRHWSKMTERLAFGVAGEIRLMADAIERTPDNPESVERITGYAAKSLQLLISYSPDEVLENPQNHQSSGLWQSLVTQSLAEQLQANLNRPFRIDADRQEKWFEISVQLEGGVMNVSLPERRVYSSSGYIFLIWMFAVSMVLLVLAILFMRGQVRPIRKLAVAAERFGRGQDSPSFKPEGAREVRQAAEAFIEMRKRIKRQIEQRTLMLAGVSHDLRTPLTRLKLQLAMEDDKPGIADMKQDVEDMERMIAGYLDFVRGEGEEEAIETALLPVIKRSASTAERQGKAVDINVPDDLVLHLKPMAFQRALDNVIGNAARYASALWVSAAIEEESIVLIRVEDNGPGIPEDMYEEVFKPFIRIDKSRNTDTGGVGLGLPIAMDVIHGHGGKIWLEKSQHGGLAVIMKLPV
ncbi:MAG: ATP-binding protein [Alphaproteobacteria bacterium]|nr:ATP-binding protein [Alphaproteobacteria bacterium]MCD8526152.1 ATP-binding protein [Alphaproteobacteria bacterium]MCD8570786.1 ATP-binding protein [Alphaproteobacteria bacterium]